MKKTLFLEDNLPEDKRDQIYGAMIGTVKRLTEDYVKSNRLSLREFVEKRELSNSVLDLLEGREALPTGRELERLMAGADLYGRFFKEVPVDVYVEKTPPTPGWLEDDRPVRKLLELSSWMYLEATRRYLKYNPEEAKR